MRIMPRVRLILRVSRRDRNAALSLLRSVVDILEVLRRDVRVDVRQHLRDRRRQRRLPMVNVTNRAYVDVGLAPVKDLLRHCCDFPTFVLALWHQCLNMSRATSHTELDRRTATHRAASAENVWSPHRGLNSGPHSYQECALPLSYVGTKAQVETQAQLHTMQQGPQTRSAATLWCREEDSNLRSTRRQVYSLLGLTAPQSLHKLLSYHINNAHHSNITKIVTH